MKGEKGRAVIRLRSGERAVAVAKSSCTLTNARRSTDRPGAESRQFWRERLLSDAEAPRAPALRLLSLRRKQRSKKQKWTVPATTQREERKNGHSELFGGRLKSSSVAARDGNENAPTKRGDQLADLAAANEGERSTKRAKTAADPCDDQATQGENSIGTGNSNLTPEQQSRIKANKAAAQAKLAARHSPSSNGSSIGPDAEDSDSMILHDPRWREVLGDEMRKSYFDTLRCYVEGERRRHTVYPPRELVFSWSHTPFDDIKVVILGQDPYHGPDRHMVSVFNPRLSG